MPGHRLRPEESTFLPIENASKIKDLKNHPKTSKVGPLIVQASILESLLVCILACIFVILLILPSAPTAEMLLYKAFRWVQHSQNHTFSNQNSINDSHFSDTSFWMSFFQILAHPGAKTLDFGTTLAHNSAQNGARDRPHGIQKGAPHTWRWHFLGVPEPTCFQDRLRSAPRNHFG